MRILFERDLSKNDDGKFDNAVISGTVIVTGVTPYRLLKIYVHAYEGRLENKFHSFVWIETLGWTPLLDFHETDFPFKVSDGTLSKVMGHMITTIKEIFPLKPVIR